MVGPFDDWLDAAREASRRAFAHGTKHRVRRLKSGVFRVEWMPGRRTNYEIMYRRHMRRCHFEQGK